MGMKRTYLYFIAVFFVCAIAIAIPTTTAKNARNSLPVSSKAVERLYGITLPRRPFSDVKNFFSHFAP